MNRYRRLIVSLLAGALLGVVCIIGAGVRAGGFQGNEFFVIGLWYNRVIMGLVIGLAAGLELGPSPYGLYLRGGLLGFVVSLAFFLTTGLRDLPALLAGIVYGVVIEYVARRLG